MGVEHTRAIRRWVDAGAIESGPLFRRFDVHRRITSEPMSDRNVWAIVKEACRRAGMDPKKFGAHSLRSGLVTQALRGGASDHAIMDQTGHRSPIMIRRYRREAELFRDNAAAKLGL